MKLGFVSAILPELELAEVLSFAASAGFGCVELMCWPRGKAERRYAGVTHIDVNTLEGGELARTKDLIASSGVSVSGLGYYPNPLTPDEEEASVYREHLKQVIRASAALNIGVVNTFIGRDWTKSLDDNWPRFKQVWPDLIRFAEDKGVRIGIENCPMFFSKDEWPAGKNLAISPAVWRRMFEEIPSKSFGLNYDPSHLIWQQIDYVKPLQEFASRLVHVHAKDAKVDKDRLDQVGILATPLEYHSPKLPGLGDVNWGRFFSALTDTGYNGAVCIEVEDRAYEGSLDDRKRALVQSKRFLENYMS
ncbi:MAG TPA: sugar phosphate isomerase/epimerase family protein [Capsulimonadaceae bacterium]|nr:sugar phosphate isomerase/epimerase family protein [Capsulimonadaceae bacterium]